MKKLTILIVVLLVTEIANAQSTFQKSFGWLPNSWESGNSVRQTMDGGFILAGAAKDTTGGSSYDEVYLIKVDSYGDTVWTKTYGKIGFNEAANEVIQTLDGGYMLAVGTGNTNVYLIKTNNIGDTLWTKTYGGNPLAYSYAHSVKQTIDSGYVVAGYYSATGSSSVDDGYILKIDAIGNVIWVKTYGGPDMDRIEDIEQTSDGGYIAVGLTESFGAGWADVYLIKTDSAGNTLWTKSYGGIKSDNGSSVQQTSDGGFIIVGNCDNTGTSSDVFFIKTNNVGDTLWTKSFGGNGNNHDLGLSVEQTIDNGYIIAGQTWNFNFGFDAYLIKTNAVGDTLWTKSYRGDLYGTFSSVQQTTDGGYIAIGHAYGSGREIYLVKTDSNGNSNCNATNLTTIVSTPAIIVTSPITIVSSPIIVLDSTDCVINSGGYITPLCTSVDINEVAIENEIIIYPNPAEDSFSINLNREIKNCLVQIYNMLGKQIYSTTLISQQEIISKMFPAGIYFVKVSFGEKQYCKKLIVE